MSFNGKSKPGKKKNGEELDYLTAPALAEKGKKKKPVRVATTLTKWAGVFKGSLGYRPNISSVSSQEHSEGRISYQKI